MKILLTGATGFLGAIVRARLAAQNQVISLGRSLENNIPADLSKEVPSIPDVDLIVHAAGKAHIVPKTPEEKQEFFDVNEQGTANLLKGVRTPPRSFIFISTVAVYGLDEGEMIGEDWPLNGETPYAVSKIKAEQLVSEWGRTNHVKVLILRLPLVVGRNPPGNLGAIIRAIRSGFYWRLGKGEARKSMVLADDVADAISNWTNREGVYNLTDGVNPTLAGLDQYLAGKYGRKVRSLPAGILHVAAKIGDKIPKFPLTSYRLAKLSHSLTFSDEKARRLLDWNPKPVIGGFDPRN